MKFWVNFVPASPLHFLFSSTRFFFNVTAFYRSFPIRFFFKVIAPEGRLYCRRGSTDVLAVIRSSSRLRRMNIYSLTLFVAMANIYTAGECWGPDPQLLRCRGQRAKKIHSTASLLLSAGIMSPIFLIRGLPPFLVRLHRSRVAIVRSGSYP